MIREFQKRMEEGGIDVSLIFNLGEEKNDPHIFYFTGLEIGFACLVVYKNKKPLLIVPEFEKERVTRESKIRNIKTIPKKKKLFEYISRLIGGCRTIGLNENNLGVYYYKQIRKKIKKRQLKDISGMLLDLRKTKSEGEIRNIREACRITDRIFKKVLLNFTKFKKETDVADFIIRKIIKYKCRAAFPPIVASGEGSALPHYTPKDTKLKKGFCVIDFGVRYRGYCSDMTRTVYIGKIKKGDAELYSLLLDVQKKTIKKIGVNKKCSFLYSYAVRHLGDYGKYFKHGLGHGIGINVHEAPNITEESKERLARNMVFTIEPGIYLKNRGIRIEDDILIGEKTAVLTKSTKKLVVIENEI